jgi:hypothetical protein
MKHRTSNQSQVKSPALLAMCAAAFVGLMFTALALSIGTMSAPALAAGSNAQAPASASGVSPAPAPADASYYPLRDQATYTSIYNARFNNIIHLDTEHATNDGFYFAIASASSGNGTRAMKWVHQPYGAKCSDWLRDLVFNPFLNVYFCALNPDRAEAVVPGFTANSVACQGQSGRPWEIDNGSGSCVGDNINIERRNISLAPNTLMGCAPWEDQSLNGSGVANCLYTSYSYIASPEADLYVPAPDACVGIPEGANAYQVSYFTENAATNVPNCTGAVNAPNCTSATTYHAACGGVPLTPVMQVPGGAPQPGFIRASATAGATTQPASVTASATRSGSASAARGPVKQTVKKKFRGREFKATGTAPVTVSRTASRTATATVPAALVVRSATRTCDRLTVEEAQACAQAAAEQAAQALANADGQGVALSTANNQAGVNAQAQAQAAAQSLATSGAVLAADEAPSRAQAKAMAKEKVNKAIKKYKNH